MSQIIANFSHYVISDYEIGDNTDLEKSLSVWDGRKYTRIPIGYQYDSEKKELRIPRGFSYSYLKKLFNTNIKVETKPQEFDKTDIVLLQPPREEIQTRVIGFLTGLGQYSYTNKYSQVFCDMRMGKGKTYCSIAAVSYFKMKVVIFVPAQLTNKLVPQWVDSILKYTNKKERHILVVKGSKMCNDILSGKYKDKEFFIFGKATVTQFAKTYGWNKFQELMEATRCGIKIIDETHMDFHTTVAIDCYSNIKRNIYLTATALRGDRNENYVFKKVFQHVPLLGKELLAKSENYINIFIHKFEHKPTTKQRVDCRVKEGLSAILYSNYLIDKFGARQKFFTALNDVIRKIFVSYKNKNSIRFSDKYYNMSFDKNSKYIQLCAKPVFNGKLLILGASREFLMVIRKFLELNFPQYSVGLYTSDIKDMKERLKELDRDIILATDKGLGTGADIEDLQFMINLIPYSNEVYANQLPGRLREIKQSVFYIEIVNIAFPEAASQYDRRVKYLTEIAKNGKIHIMEE